LAAAKTLDKLLPYKVTGRRGRREVKSGVGEGKVHGARNQNFDKVESKSRGTRVKC